MERLIHTLLFRFIELLLAIPLFRAFQSADSLGGCAHLFMSQSELEQIGTITVIALLLKALYGINIDIYKAVSDRGHKLLEQSNAVENYRENIELE